MQNLKFESKFKDEIRRGYLPRVPSFESMAKLSLVPHFVVEPITTGNGVAGSVVSFFCHTFLGLC